MSKEFASLASGSANEPGLRHLKLVPSLFVRLSRRACVRESVRASAPPACRPVCLSAGVPVRLDASVALAFLSTLSKQTWDQGRQTTGQKGSGKRQAAPVSIHTDRWIADRVSRGLSDEAPNPPIHPPSQAVSVNARTSTSERSMLTFFHFSSCFFFFLNSFSSILILYINMYRPGSTTTRTMKTAENIQLTRRNS